MKNLLKFSMFILIISLMLFSGNNVFAWGTTNDTAITNKAYVSGDNFLKISNSMKTNVRLIMGGHWAADPVLGQDQLNANGGITYSNVSYITNLGNDQAAFRLGVTSFASNPAGGSAGPWSWQYYVNGIIYGAAGTGNGGFPAATANIASGASARVVFKVTVAVAASTGWQDFLLTATNATRPVNGVAYTGDAGTGLFGGSVLNGWGAAPAGPYTLVQYNNGGSGTDPKHYRVSAQAPNMVLAKTISAISIADVNGVDNIAIPGATITFQLRVTNIGPGAANKVVVKDSIDSRYLTNPINQAVAGGTEVAWTMTIIGNMAKFSNNDGVFESGNVARLTFQATIK